jgi:hypothetical protein
MRIAKIAAGLLLIAQAIPAAALDQIVEKHSCSLPTYTTVGKRTIKDVRIGPGPRLDRAKPLRA